MSSAPQLWVVVSCMGRLAHLRLTAPRVVESSDVGYCLVDYSCPDQAGRWLLQSHPEPCAEGRAKVVTCPGQRLFHKTRALNLGARAAIEAGAEYLCFADADTLFAPGSFERIRGLLAPGRFWMAATRAGRSVRSLTGLLIVSAGDFERSGGYDEDFVGWGSEDIAMRLKLHLVIGLGASWLPAGTVAAIPHTDRLRTRHAADPDLLSNARRNEEVLMRLVQAWTGRPFSELPASARELLFLG